MEKGFIRAIAARTFVCFERTLEVIVSDWHPSIDHLADAYYLVNAVSIAHFRDSLPVDSVKTIRTDAEAFASIFS